MIEPTQLHSVLAERGYVVFRAAELREDAERDPWSVARRLWGDDIAMVEAHPIHPAPHGRSFASTSGHTPLHSDSQSYRGVPPRVQVMLCLQPAAQGGETVLLDTWALLDQIELEEPELHKALLTQPRRIPFVFGDVVGPTVGLRGGSVVFTHSPVPARDEVGRRLASWIERTEVIDVRVEAGEVLVVDNHRMLHGRRSFEDPTRRFLRLLLWTSEPGPAPARLRAAVTAAYERAAKALRRQAPTLRNAFGSVASAPSEAERRLAIVLEMLRGTSPGMLAHHHGVPEPELYRWRDAALQGAIQVLDRLPSADDHRDELERRRHVLERKLR